MSEGIKQFRTYLEERYSTDMIDEVAFAKLEAHMENRVETFDKLARAAAELCSRIEDGRELVKAGSYDLEDAYGMAEKQAVRVRSILAIYNGPDQKTS